MASATINGVAATSIQIADVGGGTPRLSIWSAVVPSGTTGIEFVPTFTSAGSGMDLACACWYGYPAVSTPLDSGQAIGNFVSTRTVSDIQIATGGFVIAATASSSASADPFSMSWTGTDTPTEHADTSLGTGLAYAFYSFATTASTTTDDATFTASVSDTGMGSVVASFGA